MFGASVPWQAFDTSRHPSHLICAYLAWNQARLIMTNAVETNTQAMTPMMRQYYELKERCGNAILFFRMGDFYEIFGPDAEEVAPVLELVLTSRERGDQQRIPFCGVPHHSARNYWLRLLRKGYKIALADQIEDPAEAKGLVKRDIVKILTPGCIDDPEGLDQDSPNYLMAVHEEPGAKVWTVVAADLSTGELRLGNVSSLNAVRDMVEQFRAKELLARRFFHQDLTDLLSLQINEHRLLIEPLPEAPLRDPAEQVTLLKTALGQADLDVQPCGKVIGGAPLLAAVLTHFKSLQASLAPFMCVKPLSEPESMVLDETAIRDLELFETVRRRQTEGSLFREINQTLSPMGARLLRFSMAHPLLSREQLRLRHAAVRSLVQAGEHRLGELRSELRNLPDLERLAARVHSQAISPIELGRVLEVLGKSNWLLSHLKSLIGEDQSSGIYQAVALGLAQHEKPLTVLRNAIEDLPRALGTGEGVMRQGFDPELDRLNALARSGESQVEGYQERLRAATGIGSLKIKQHKSYGLLIEVTKTHNAKVPAEFIRRQTMVNCDRYSTVELQELDQELASAQDRAVAREAEMFLGTVRELGVFRNELQGVIEALSTFDLLQSFAWQAIKHHYTEPQLSSDERLELLGSRHPVVERYVGKHKFAPNDIVLTREKRHLLITGPNMAGKSTAMRQTAISAILSQIGSFVPARVAILPVFDRIFTRVGAADDLSRGQSTFMVEMSEAAHILRNATNRSLVILDEVGRGTSTVDGLAIASAILQDLAQRISCFSLFATHYHELVPFAESLPSVRPMRTEVLEQAGAIVFTHRLKDGASDSSYGLEVARIAGLPVSVLSQAAAIVRRDAGIEKQIQIKHVAGASKFLDEALIPLEKAGLSPTGPKPLPKPVSKLMDQLEKLNLNRTTPLQALNFLSEIQSHLKVTAQRSLFDEDS